MKKKQSEILIDVSSTTIGLVLIAIYSFQDKYSREWKRFKSTCKFNGHEITKFEGNY